MIAGGEQAEGLGQILWDTTNLSSEEIELGTLEFPGLLTSVSLAHWLHSQGPGGPF